jgi:predicted secreted Zn-dependent protease
LFLFRILAAFLFVSQSAAQDKVTVVTNYYFVTGSTIREMRESMAKTKPARMFHDGQTDWHIEWKFTSASGETNCWIQTLTVDALISTTLPRWIAPTNPAPELLSRWKGYMAALEKHENGHRIIAHDAAKALRAELRNIQGPCETFERAVKLRGDKILAQYKKRESDYDLKTEHGLAEGARFP